MPNADRRLPDAERRAPDADGRAPIFLWVHLYDPHAPYVGGYDAEVQRADAETGRLLQEARAAGRDPVVIVVSDHGESLGDHGEATHGMLVYDAALRVPLIVAGPGISAARRDDPVSLVDVAATLARLGGVTEPIGGSARDLLGPPAADREIYAESQYPRVAGWSPVHTLVQDRWKLVVSRGSELYDLASDAAEQHDVAASRQNLVTAMGTRLATLRAAKTAASDASRAKSDASPDVARGNAARSDRSPRAPGSGASPGARGSTASPSAPGSAASPGATASTASRSATGSTAAPRATASEVAERLRALGYVAASTRPIEVGEGDNPAEHIAAWGEFETALAELGQRDKAVLPRLRKLATTYPDAPVFQSTYARALLDSDSPRDALVVYRRAVTRWTDDPALFHDLAVAARAAGHADEALKAEQAALTIEPSLPSAHNGVGLLMADAGRHADATAAFERAASGDPTNAEYWVNLGNARRTAGHTRGAAEAYRRAADLDPRSADAANGLGVLLVEEKRAAEAVPLFERAVSAAPDFVEARLNLAIAYQESGQRERAAAAYRDVLARARPGSRERQAAAELLRNLR